MGKYNAARVSQSEAKSVNDPNGVNFKVHPCMSRDKGASFLQEAQTVQVEKIMTDNDNFDIPVSKSDVIKGLFRDVDEEKNCKSTLASSPLQASVVCCIQT